MRLGWRESGTTAFGTTAVLSTESKVNRTVAVHDSLGPALYSNTWLH